MIDSSPRTLANAIRALAMDAVEAAKSGHPGMPMGMADAATALFTNILKYDPADPHWPDRDRFILSAGHGSMLLYALLYLTGYAAPTMDDIRRFRQWGSPCAGHPEVEALPGVEVTTGPLGQGLAMAVGQALAERHLNARFGDALVDHYTYVIAGDGCLMEGVSQEAISLAGHLGLRRLILLWDDNQISIDGPTSLATSENMKLRFEAAGWDVQAVDGHDATAVTAALLHAKTTTTPSLIACRTTIGYGAPGKQGSEKAHGAPLGKEEVAAARAQLGWTAVPFEIPDDILAAWRTAGGRHAAVRAAWAERLAAHPDRTEFERRQRGDLPTGLVPAIRDYIDALLAKPEATATRKASENILQILATAVPELLGGSADLTGSNYTRAKPQTLLTSDDYGGQYLHYGVREFGMAAAMNGLALHGGVIPYGGTFLVFADYCRPAIRLAALQQARAIYVLTHDSIGVGEDGPTHQPIEHLASLRLIPNVRVFRPCDAVETAECWQLALEYHHGPSILALSRQNLPPLRLQPSPASRCATGGYILSGAPHQDIVLIATGSEVSLAVDVAQILEKNGKQARVVSMPCLELFAALTPDEQAHIVPPAAFKVVIEAGSSLSWHRLVSGHGLIFGIDHFGASAPGDELFRRYGFAPQPIADTVLAAL